MKFLSNLKNKDLSKKTCLLRVDLNIGNADLPLQILQSKSWKSKSGHQHRSKQEIPFRLEAILPTIRFLTDRGAKAVILSHRGRPPKTKNLKLETKNYSLKPFAKILSRLLNKSVQFIDFNTGTYDVPKLSLILKTSDVQNIKNSPPGSVFLAENLRFFPEEEKNDKKFAKHLASLGDFYVNDAFSVSHRKHASVVAITKYLPSYAGLLLEKEIKNLNKIKKPRKPFIVVLGGAKISDKIGLLENFKNKADCFLLGGGIANTIIAAQGLPVGDSLYEPKMLPFAKQLLKLNFDKIVLPVDALIENRKILDIGPQTIKKFGEIINKAKTIIWNGPMGYFENPKFAKGSEGILKAILKSRAFSVIGGGETISLLRSARINADKEHACLPANRDKRRYISENQRKNQRKSAAFISTGGGAMLEYLAGRKLPGIEALKQKLK